MTEEPQRCERDGRAHSIETASAHCHYLEPKNIYVYIYICIITASWAKLKGFRNVFYIFLGSR